MYKNVLYLSYDGMTDPLGQSQVIPYLQGLSNEGYQITVISFEKSSRYSLYKDTIKELLEGSGIQWVPLKYYKYPPILSTLFDVWRMNIKAKRLHQEQRVNIVHCRSYLSALVGLSMKKRYGTKFLFDMRGFWANERIEGGIWNQNNIIFNWIYKFFKKKEKLFLEQADYTISLTEDGKKIIHEWGHIQNNPIPIKVIPCCADLSLFNRNEVTSQQAGQLREKLGIDQDDFILLYLGSIGTWYMLDEMLDFFKVLSDYKARARFLFLTKDNPRHILSTASSKGIDNNRLIITSVERNDLPKHMALAHLSVFFIKPVFSKRASSPTKQGELMGMGIPIVCNSGVGDTAEIIRQTNSGAVVANLSEEEYRLVCREIDSLVSLSTDEIRMSAKKYYSLYDGIKAYAGIYKKLL